MRRVVIHRPDLTRLTPEQIAAQIDGQRPAAEPAPAPERASLLTKFGRLRRELGRWAKAGFTIVPKDVRAWRLAGCQPCEFYAPEGNLGLGECRHPGCGCTRAKLLLATSQCPKSPPAWGPWSPPGVL